MTAILPLSASAQAPESDRPPVRGEFVPAPQSPLVQSYALPDFKPGHAEKNALRKDAVTLKFGFVVLEDYSAFEQDDSSLRQVGPQENRWDSRAIRLVLRGTVGRDYQMGYMCSVNYSGLNSTATEAVQVMDAIFTFPLGGPTTTLTVGKTKETFCYEMVGDSANLPQQERVLNPFFVSRNVGAKVTRVIGAEHRMTASLGVFNDWWLNNDPFESSGTDVTARVTGLLWDREGRDKETHFLHLGVSGRYNGADKDALRYRGRPESNVADYFVDTGVLPADHAWHMGLEALWNRGPFSLLAEYNRAWVSSGPSRDPEFSGWYLTGSWILTGETRPYDRTIGYARRVLPKRRWGAPEIVARFSHIDLTDGHVHGGTYDKTYLGLNWWATRRWKFGVGWGHTSLDRYGLDGGTDIALFRAQWVY